MTGSAARKGKKGGITTAYLLGEANMSGFGFLFFVP
jgi:hypothetical protein